jgi:hypothetical protein
VKEPIDMPAAQPLTLYACAYVRSSELCDGREKAAPAVSATAAGSWGDAAHTLVTVPEYLGWLEEAAGDHGLWIDESDTFVSADGDDEDPELTAQLNAMREALMAVAIDPHNPPYIDMET